MVKQSPAHPLEYKTIAQIDLQIFIQKHSITDDIQSHPKFQTAPELSQNLLAEYANTPISKFPALLIELTSYFDQNKIKWLTKCLQVLPPDQIDSTIFLLKKLSIFDFETFIHSIRVAKKTREFATRFEVPIKDFALYQKSHRIDAAKHFYFDQHTLSYKFTPEHIDEITVAGLLHDIGKMGVSIEIINPAIKQVTDAQKIENLAISLESTINQILNTPNSNKHQLIEIADRLTQTHEQHLEANQKHTHLNLITPTETTPELKSAIQTIRQKLLPFIVQLFKSNHRTTESDVNKLVDKILALPIPPQSQKALRQTSGSFDKEQRQEMNTHSAISKIITDTFNFPEKIGLLALHHHQQGKEDPYPCDIPTSQLTLAQGILNFSDIMVALQEDRPYRKGHSLQSATKIMLSKEHQFTPLILQNFKRILIEEQVAIIESDQNLPAVITPPMTPPPQSKAPQQPSFYSFDALSHVNLPQLRTPTPATRLPITFSHDEPDKALGLKPKN